MGRRCRRTLHQAAPRFQFVPLSDSLGDRSGEHRPGRRVELASAPHDPQPAAILMPWDHVNMDVKDRLVGAGPIVLQQVVRFASCRRHHRAADPRERPPQGGSGVIRQRVQRRCGLLRDDQSVPATERKDVQKCEHMSILKHAMARDFPADDLRKDGVGHTRGYQPSWRP